MSEFLSKGSWFYAGPGVTMSEQLVNALSQNHKALLLTAMPKDTQLLLGSRIQGQLFCLTTKQSVKDVSFCPLGMVTFSEPAISR